MKHERRVRRARNDQLDIDAARDRVGQRLDELRIGNEVGVREQHLSLGAVEGRDQRHVDLAERLVGVAADRAHHLVALAREHRKVVARGERRALLVLPRVDEELLQGRDNGAFDEQVGVAPGQHLAVGRTCGSRAARAAQPRRACAAAARVDAADVHAAEHRAPAVDDEELAVVALVDVPAGLGLERIDRVELEHVDAGVGQPLEERFRRGERADAVVDQVHLDALCLLGDELVGEALAGLVGLEDVGLHVDAVACRVDRIEHRCIRVRAVLEQGHVVAERERTVGDGLLEREVACQHVAVAGAAVREPGDDLAAAFGRDDAAARSLELDTGRIRPRHVGRDDRQRAAAGE